MWNTPHWNPFLRRIGCSVEQISLASSVGKSEGVNIDVPRKPALGFTSTLSPSLGKSS
jgi:hypothetical protein